MSTQVSDRAGPRPLVGAAAVALLAVALVTVADPPPLLRTLVCLPVLVGISGALMCLAFLPEWGGLDGLSRAGLVLLMGLGTLVVSGMIVALILRNGLPVERVVLADVLLTAVPLAVLSSRSAAPSSLGLRRPTAALWSVLAGVALLAGALVIGTRIAPLDDDAKPTFSFTGPAATAGGPTLSRPGVPVSLDVVLRNVGPPSAGTGLQAVLDGQPAQIAYEARTQGAGEYRGVVTILAPADPGVHRLVLSAPSPDQRLELVTYIDVRN